MKKNVNLFIYSIIFLIFYTVFGFIFHLTRIGSSGNQNVPLNISYGGFLFYYCFIFLFFIFSLLFDFDIKDEINTNKIYFLLTGNITRIEFYIGKVFFYFIFFSFFMLLFYLYSYLIASYPFGRLPILLNGNYMDKNLFLQNAITNYLLLLPLFFFIANITFFSGFFFKLSSLSLIFYVFIVLYLLLSPFKNIMSIFYPFSKIIIHNNFYNNFQIIEKEIIRYILFLVIANSLILIIIIKNINKREF
ncbi:MAG: hypothetical protein N3A58_02255 [Spirochaetes bacterium]|nr:hypothetical protein [Spirochaetota bacterium]